MTNQTIHRGEIVEKVLRNSGHSLAKLAGKLGITRNTLYNRFEKADLSYEFIRKVGKVICYDFTIHFPEMKEIFGLLDKDQATKLWSIETEYAELLEKHAKLLAILASIANDNELPALHQEITQFLEKEKEGKV